MIFNINDCVSVKLTETGKQIYHDHMSSLGLKAPLLSQDEDGWSTWQMWDVMLVFGKHFSMGGILPVETNIKIVHNQDAEVSALREMLALSAGGPHMYLDDGELQDTSAVPHIDFKRDGVDSIRASLQARERARLITLLVDYESTIQK